MAGISALPAEGKAASLASPEQNKWRTLFGGEGQDLIDWEHVGAREFVLEDGIL